MITNVLNPKWCGHHAKSIDPASVRFTIAQAAVYADCQGCIFAGQRSEVCKEAVRIAKAAGIQDCDDPLPNGSSGVYVLDKTDPRQQQIDLEQGEAAKGATDAASITNNKGEIHE